MKTITNEEASSRGLSGKTRMDRPTYAELALSVELEKAQEEIRRLRAALSLARETAQLLAEVAGCPEVAENL
jgi:hypothetical protein